MKHLYYINRPDISTLIDVSNGIINDYSVLLDLVEKDKDDNYIWNTWSYDGTTFDDEYLNALQNIKINNETYLDAKHNAINDYILIKYNGDVLVNSSTDDKDLIDPSTNEIIKKRLNDATIEDIIDELSLFETNPNMANSLLNDKCYIKHDSKFTIIDVDNYIKIYIDSDYDIKNVNFEDYTGDNFIRLWNCNSMTYLNNEEPQLKYQHENVNNEDNKSSKLFVNNYIVPMDIFRYCSNNCNINYAFKNIASFNNNYKSLKYNDHIYGIIGRIPPRIFEKLTDTENIKGVFDDYKKLNPYSQSLTGEFDSNIFKYNTKLKNISDLFSNCMLLGNLHIDIFAYNKELRNISNIFKNSYMSPEYGVYTDNKNDYINFVDNKIFRNNINLNNLSGAFSREVRSDNIQNGYLYFDIDNSLLTPKNNQYLNNVSSLFAYQKGIQRDSSKIDEWIDFSKGWSFINGNYTNCYLDANFNRNKIPTTMGGNMIV